MEILGNTMNRNKYINQVINESRNDSIEVPAGADKLVDLFDEIVRLEKRRAELAETLEKVSDGLRDGVLEEIGVSLYPFNRREDLYDFLSTGDVFTGFLKDVENSECAYVVEKYEKATGEASASKAELLDEMKKDIKDAILWKLDEIDYGNGED